MSFQVDTNNLKPNTPRVLLKLFKEVFGDLFHLYEEGVPILVGSSDLPAIFVSEPHEVIDLGPTGHDDLTHEVLIQVLMDKKKEFGNPDHGSGIDFYLDALIQGRDATTGDYKDETIMAILRRNITLGSYALENIVTVDKGVVPRENELKTVEAHVGITLKEIQAVANRT